MRHPCSKFWLSISIYKVQRTSMSFKSLFWALIGAGGSWLGSGILTLILIWSLVFYTPIFRILVLYFDFEGAKNIHVLYVLIWGFGGGWRLLTGVSYLNLNMDMVTGLWYTLVPNFGSLLWFWRYKEHPCPLCPDMGLWWGLEVLDWDFTSWYWFGYGHLLLVYPNSIFWFSIIFLKM